MRLTENKLRNIIRESIINILNENNNSQVNEYLIFYIDNGNPYDGIYNTTYECKNDKQAFSLFLKEYDKVFLANLDGDINKEERYAIGKVSGTDEFGDNDYDIIYDITLYTKNGKKTECRYTYNGPDGYQFGDTHRERNEKKFSAQIEDWLGRTLQEIPSGYCGSMSMLKKYLHTYLTKQINNNPDKDSLYVRIYDFNKEESKTYSAYIGYDGKINMYEYDPLEMFKK